MSYTYSTYITTWDNDPYDQLQDMISKGVVKPGVRVILAFASFNFSSTEYIPGFGNISIDEVKNITYLAHSVGANISLSIGGATYPFANSDLYSQPGFLASNINTVLSKCGFDGADFDIEDYYGSVPTDFAVQAASLINTLKSTNPSLAITLTTAAQAWAPGCYQQNLINMTIGNLTAYQPMEYDIWLDTTNTYAQQIEWDINFYTNTWGITPSKIVLGLMPGNDDMSRNLTLQDALNLTTFAMNSNLQGVMTWDANNDSKGVDGNAPYAYSLGIESSLFRNNNRRLMGMHRKRKFEY